MLKLPHVYRWMFVVLDFQQEAQLSQRDCATHCVNWNLVDCCTLYENTCEKGYSRRSLKVIRIARIRTPK